MVERGVGRVGDVYCSNNDTGYDAANLVGRSQVERRGGGRRRANMGRLTNIK